MDVAVLSNKGELELNQAVGLVNLQWEKAQNGLFEIIKFGALVHMLETSLQRETRRGCIQSGETLKGWLSENCPQVNYKTTLGYRDAAREVRRLAEIPEELPLLALIDGGVEEAAETHHARVMEIIANSTISGLKSGEKKKVEKPKRLPPTPEEEEAQAAQEAALALETAVNLISAFASGESWRFLDRDTTRFAVRKIKDDLKVIAAGIENMAAGWKR